jgi:Ca2+:H+ antiporter
MSLNWLLVFVPIALGLNAYGANAIVVFATSALALVPLAALMGRATDALAEHVGPTWGGLMSASLGNAPEVIISFFALRQGLVAVVKSSLVGSIIGNLLLGLGLSMFFGGTKNGTQSFDLRIANMNAGLLLLAASGLIIPAVFQHSSAAVTRGISVQIAAVLFLIYLGGLIFTMTEGGPPSGKQGEQGKIPAAPVSEKEGPSWGKGKALFILAIVTVTLAIMSEVLTGAIEPASEDLGLTKVFAGVFLLALVGNVAELFNAVRFARRDKMDLAVGVTVGASLQVALVVTPVLVFAAAAIGQPMDLVFSRFEIVAVFLTVMLTRQLIANGRSNWLEGLMLVGVYVMLGIGFFYLPPIPGR